MKRLQIVVILQFVLCYTVSSQEFWENDIVDYHNWVNSLVIADGQNDGVQRIYGATDAGSIYEWTYNAESSGWTKKHCKSIYENLNNFGRMFYGFVAGDGHNDGKIRLYAVCMSGLAYEFSYINETETWDVVKLDNGSLNKPQGILVGDTRNDNINRIVSNGVFQSTLYKVNEYTWDKSNSNYELNYIVNQKRELFQGAMGDARNDGSNAIYLPDVSANVLREYKWNGESYEEKSISVSMTPHRLVIGDARNDGLYRIYVSDGFGDVGGNGYIKEVSYENESWINNTIHSTYFAHRGRHVLALGKVRENDGLNRLYSVAREGYLVEHSYKNSKWETDEIDGATGATATIAIGQARNDAVNRIYIAGDGGKIIEYSHKNGTGNSSVQREKTDIRNYPNPCNKNFSLEYHLQKEAIVKLTIYNTIGDVVVEKEFANQCIGKNTTPIDCSELTTGTYFYKLMVGNKSIGINKILIVK